MDKQIMNCPRCCNRCCNKCYNNYRHEHCGYYNYNLPDYHFNFHYPPSNDSPSGTLVEVCDGTEYFVFDSKLPSSWKVTVYNHGDCPAQIWIYYTKGFYLERLGKLIQVGEKHIFDTVDSILQVSITCDPIRCPGGKCNPNNAVDHCIVDYWLS